LLADDILLKAHLHQIRLKAWQVTQEYGVARWWFLKSTIGHSPFYQQIAALVRHGASVADVACGMGQELRFLREDGATGDMWGIDIRSDIWDIGLELFKDSPGPGTFVHADLLNHLPMTVNEGNRWSLDSLNGKVDLFLMNEYPSFHRPSLFEFCFATVMSASKIGSRITGWVFGTNYYDENHLDVLEFCRGGMVHHPKTFRNWIWRQSELVTGTRWDLDIKLVELEELGFGSGTRKVLLDYDKVKLMGLCYMAKRIT
jgi:SAM-dependent methyltransferase